MGGPGSIPPERIKTYLELEGITGDRGLVYWHIISLLDMKWVAEKYPKAKPGK